MKHLRGITVETIVGAFAICVVLLSSLGCSQHMHQGLLPKDVVGAWTTQDPRYKDRLMELSRAFVIIVTDRHEPASVQMIDRVETEPAESEPAESETRYTIYSTDYSQGTHLKMTIQYSAANGGELRFRNQPAVWTRHIEIPNKPPKSR